MSEDINLTSHYLDVVKQGDRFQVVAGPTLRRTKWRSGTWVRYVEGEADFMVEKANGVYTCGFLLYGSEDYTDARISNYRNFSSYQNTGGNAVARGGATLTLVTGGGRFLFAEFETQALNPQGQRDPNLPITYTLNEDLRISENGLLCNDSEALIKLATGGNQAPPVGVCSKTPSTENNKLGLDLKY